MQLTGWRPPQRPLGSGLRDIAYQIVNGIRLSLHALAARAVHRFVIVLEQPANEEGDRKNGEELSGLA